MDKPIKRISLTAIGSAAWLVCAVAMPMQQGAEQTGMGAWMANLLVPAAYADSDDDKSNSGSSSSVKAGWVCVSLEMLTESIGKDKTNEDDKVEGENDEKDSEYQAKADEEEYARVEREAASQAEANGDDAGKSDHDSKAKDGDNKSKDHEDKAKDHEDKAKDHEDKAKDHEDKAKDHEDKARGYADTKANVEALKGNCMVPGDKPGVWIPGTPSYVIETLKEDGGANKLLGLIGQTVNDKTPDSSMESYREIRGE